MSLIDDYRLLELPTNATEQEAKAAFRRLAGLYHPDKNPDKDTTEHFQRLQVAYQNILNAIKQGAQAGDWKPYQFTQSTSRQNSAFRQYRSTSSTSDEEQREFIRERQRAYEEMKRNNAQYEKSRNEAIKTARNTLNEKRVKALYEEAFKASKGFDFSNEDQGKEQNTAETSVPPYDSFMEEAQTVPSSTPTFVVNAHSIRTYAAKAALRAVSYLACFAAGIYATLYWQSAHQENTPLPKTIPYIAGIYPQFRNATNYTLFDTKMYAEPDITTNQIQSIPAFSNVQVIKSQGDWLTIRYQNMNGWVQTKNFGFGTAEYAMQTGCIGQPGPVPRNGQLIGNANGKSRLRVINRLSEHSILTFESYDGRPPFSIYLHAGQSYAANYIPKGHYRLVLETGSLYHQACQRFLFNDTTRVILENVDFASTEQSLTLQP